MWNIFKKKKKAKPISFKEAINLTELPVITFTNNKQKLNFIFDTGATKSLIDKTILPSLNYQKSEDKTITTGVGGASNILDNIIMDLKHGEQNFTETFQTMDLTHVVTTIKTETGVTVHGLLGNTFFQEYGYIIDYNDFIVYNKR